MNLIKEEENTNLHGKNPYWEVNSRSATEQISYILLKAEVRYHLRNFSEVSFGNASSKYMHLLTQSFVECKTKWRPHEMYMAVTIDPMELDEWNVVWREDMNIPTNSVEVRFYK
jgi:hypothetical protein